jgi:hypothetical protein
VEKEKIEREKLKNLVKAQGSRKKKGRARDSLCVKRTELHVNHNFYIQFIIKTLKKTHKHTNYGNSLKNSLLLPF